MKNFSCNDLLLFSVKQFFFHFSNQTGCGDKSASDCDALQYHNGKKLINEKIKYIIYFFYIGVIPFPPTDHMTIAKKEGI